MRTFSILTVALFTLVCASPYKLAGQSCESAKITSLTEAKEYLDQATDNSMTEPCVALAFKAIASAPSAQSVPLLITYLQFKRPLNDAERHGIFMHGNDSAAMYPAVQALFETGPAAQPALVHLVGTQYDETSLARSNALYTLLLIHHGNALEVVKLLMTASHTTNANATAANLRSAAKSFSNKWCSGSFQKKCEALTAADR